MLNYLEKILKILGHRLLRHVRHKHLGFPQSFDWVWRGFLATPLAQVTRTPKRKDTCGEPNRLCAVTVGQYQYKGSCSMIICSQCEFENSDTNKFCQNCGISLTDKISRECGANTTMDAENCYVCGASNQIELWAIISQQKRVAELVPAHTPSSFSKIDKKLEIGNLSDLFEAAKAKAIASGLSEVDYLKYQQRYIFQTTNEEPEIKVANGNSVDTLIQGKAFDLHPSEKSHLATLQKQQMDLFAELTQDLDNSYLSLAQYWNLIGIPTHALPYLILKEYTPIVPEIYDAWQQSDRGVVLLPDRSQWQLLKELWSQEQSPLLQIVWFLDEMAKLWEPLSRINCAQSLLVDSNLRVDEDQSFCLQQLYLDSEDNPPSLKDLAKTWQVCFANSNQDYLQDLNQLLEKAISGEIQDIEQLRQKLHALDCELDSNQSFNISTEKTKVNTDRSPSEFSQSQPSEEQSLFNETNESMVYDRDVEEQATEIIQMRLNSVVDASCTDIGSQRNHNEDFFCVKTSTTKIEKPTETNIHVRGMYVVCDGMGGHSAGEVASAMAVENLQQYFQTHWQEELPDRQTIEAGILATNNLLYQTNLDNSRSGNGRMGTTLVMALLQDTNLAIAHVGDSRIYRITRKHGLEQLTTDHEVGQREINRGVEPEIAYGRPDSYQLTQALGPRDNKSIRPEIQLMEITEDCLLLLCSDGLSDNNLLEKHWENYLQPLISSSSNLEEGLFKLIEFANHYNGHDNITSILVRIKLKPNF